MRRTGGLRVYSLLLVLAFVAGACSSSGIDPEADVSIGGKVLGPDGTALAGRPVVLTREPDLGEVFFTGAFAGLPCLTDDPPPICEGARIEETDDGGQFAFSVKGKDTQGFFGQASTLALSTSAPRAGEQIEGPAVTHRFQVQTTALTMPLRIWDPDVSATGDVSSVSVSYQPVDPQILPGDGGGTLSTSVRFQKSSGELVWLAEDHAPSAPIDSRVLEDTSGDVSVLTYGSDIPATAAEGTKVSALFRSGRWRYVSPVGAPISRGKPCFVLVGSAVEPFSPCRLTDGVFDEPALDPCPAGGCPEGVRPGSVWVDLGEVTEVTLVVVRGCADRCGVQLSSDGSAWRPVSTVQPSVGLSAASQNVPVPVPAGSLARMVRIDMEPVGLSGLKEVSVWGPVTPASQPFQEGQQGSILRGAPDSEAQRRSLRGWAPLLIAIIVVLAVATIVVARRRARQKIA